MAAAYRLLVRLLSAAVGWIPMLVVAWLGGGYLLLCLATLRSPSLPVRLTYQATGGVAEATAERYSVDLERRQAVVFGLKVRDGSGRTTAEAERLTVSLRDGRPEVDISRVSLNLVRTRDAGVDLSGVLPPPPSTPQPSGAGVKIGRLEVSIEDQVLGRTVSAALSKAEIQEGDGHVLLNGLLSLDGSKDQQIALQVSPRGEAMVRLMLDELDAGPQLDLIRSWLPREALAGWEKLSSRQLIVSGPLRLEIHPAKQARIAGRVQVRAGDFRLPGLLQADRLTGEVEPSDAVVRLNLRVQRSGLDASFRGEARLDRLSLAGDLDLTARDRAALGPDFAGLLPGDVTFRGASFRGPVRLTDRPAASGRLKLDRLSSAGQEFRALDAEVGVSGDRGVIRMSSARWIDRLVSGWASWGGPRGELKGAFRSPQAGLDGLARLAGAKGLQGRAAVSAVLQGSLARPTVHLRARGEAAWQGDADSEPFRAEAVQAAGVWTPEEARLERFLAESDRGTLAASGSFSSKTGLNLEVESGGLRVDGLAEGLKGLARFSVKAAGPLDRLRVSGPASAYGLEWQGRSIPIARGQVDSIGRTLRLTDLAVQPGSGVLQGFATYDFENGRIGGRLRAQDVLVSDWSFPDLVGLAEAPEIALSGTVERPQVSAQIRSDQLLLAGIEIDNAFARVEVRDGRIDLEDLSATLAGGRLTGEGSFAQKDFSGSVSLEAADIDLARLPTGGVVDLSGVLSGVATYTRTPQGEDRAGAGLRLDRVAANGSPLGSGSLSANWDGREATGNAALGSLDRFITVNRFRLDPTAETVDANVDLFNIELANLISAASPSARNLEVRLRQILRSVEGDLTAAIQVDGPMRDPNVGLTDFEVSGLSVLDREAGRLTAEIRKSGPVWTVPKAEWTLPDSPLRLENGVFSPERIEGLASLDNFDLTWLNIAFPDLPPLAGRADAVVLGGGTPESPDIQASVRVSDSSVQLAGGERLTLFDLIDLDSILVQNGTVQAFGQVRSRGFAGRIQASAPFTAFAPENPEGEASLEVRLLNRPLSELL
ncbi:MAG: hypothetical protein MH204_09150 [Fimbriimonadaceae bacterium]|nr:hypothetical protein [Fimbriimonadaceae bacterium]